MTLQENTCICWQFLGKRQMKEFQYSKCFQLFFIKCINALKIIITKIILIFLRIPKQNVKLLSPTLCHQLRVFSSPYIYVPSPYLLRRTPWPGRAQGHPWADWDWWSHDSCRCCSERSAAAACCSRYAVCSTHCRCSDRLTTEAHTRTWWKLNNLQYHICTSL